MDEIIERMREELKEREGSREEKIELGRVRDFLLAMDEPAAIRDGDPIPPLFLLTLARSRRPQPSKGTAVKISDECRFLKPVRVGDVIVTTTRVTDIVRSEGKRGPAFTYGLETSYRNQAGDTVAIALAKAMRWGQ